MSQGLTIGALLDHGKYRVEKVLGQGGFGLTYLVTDLGLDKPRAIKEFFPKDYCERDETTSQVSLGTRNTEKFVTKLKAKFIKEARNIASLDQHSGIVHIHTVFEENNTAYYVMDYIEGESLSALVKRTGPLPEEKALKYIKQVAEALKNVHAHNINHLDIKPANIMIRKKDDRAILIDFGLAKQYDEEGYQTSTTPTGISHGYAPIEQYDPRGLKRFTPQTDIYSLAATLYYILTAQVPPFSTEMANPQFEFPYSGPARLLEPIRRGMAYAIQSRPETVEQFVASLDNAHDVLADVEPVTTIEGFEDEVEEPEVVVVKTPEPHATTGGGGGSVKGPDRAATGRILGMKPRQIAIWGGGAIFLALAVWLAATLLIGGEKIENNAQLVDTETVEPMAETTDATRNVTNMAYKSSLGLCSYTGEVDENNLPNGYGVATWETGDGKKYNGEWKHGVMDGQTVYTVHNGDTFKGTFKNGQYDQGRYTIKENGYYFVGSFKNGEPYKGTWYDKEGNVENTI